MSKVRLINLSKESSRITGFGIIQFDADGLSVEEIDRGVAEQIASVSSSIIIEGEENKRFTPTIPERKEKINPTMPDGLFTEDQVNQKLIEQGERLLNNVAKVLGLEKEEIVQKLREGIESEPCVLIPVSQLDVIEEEATGTIAVENKEETVEEATGDEKADGDEKPVEEKATIQAEETGLSDGEKEKREQIKEKLERLNLEALRNILTEAGIKEEKWVHLKGKEAKATLIEIILSEVHTS